MLSHPTQQMRDTQVFAYQFGLDKNRYPALRYVAKRELGIDIQSGEHSSVCLILPPSPLIIWGTNSW
jgi:RNA exonuclease 4